MNPFDLPVHPLVVHFPLAMLTTAWVCLLCRYGLQDQRWGDRAKTFETIGVATLPLTIIAGFVDTRGFGFAIDRVRWDQPLIWHAIVSLAAAVVFAGHWWWQRTTRTPSIRTAIVDLGWATLGLWALALTGAIAGEMVYAA